MLVYNMPTSEHTNIYTADTGKHNKVEKNPELSVDITAVSNLP